MAGLPYIPLLFRGYPKGESKSSPVGSMIETNEGILRAFLVNMGMDSSRFQELPASKAERCHADLSDKAVWNLYPKRLMNQIGGIFARLLPVIPISNESLNGIHQTLAFLGSRLPNIDTNPISAKQVVFLESEDDLRLLEHLCPICARADRYLRRCDIGLLYAIPLYRRGEVRNVQGTAKVFLQTSNNQLELVHPALRVPRDVPPPSSKRII